MAFGRGEISGGGLGNSIQKLDYLPEAHTQLYHGDWWAKNSVLLVFWLL